MQKKYIILDDDSKSILKIQSVMERFSNFTFVAAAATYDDGLNLILELQPDLVFLEINPIDKSSKLSLLLINELHRYLSKIPQIIVVSEDSSFAFEALKYGIAAYLLKPIAEVDLRKTFLRIEKFDAQNINNAAKTISETTTTAMIAEKESAWSHHQKNAPLQAEFTANELSNLKNEVAALHESLTNLLLNTAKSFDPKELTDLIIQTISENLAVVKEIDWPSIINDNISVTPQSSHATVTQQEHKRKLICIKSYGDYRFLELDDLAFLQADNNSTDITLNSGEKITAFKTLKYFEENLPSNFYRIHNSYIVNKDYISRIHTGNSLCYIKNTKIQIPFSKGYKDNIDLILTQLAGSEFKDS